MMKQQWQQIQQYIRDSFHIEPEIHNILYLIGIQELGYGFNKLDKDNKTKVFNFVSLYMMRFLCHEEKTAIRKESLDEEDYETKLYKKAIINYFKQQHLI